MQQFFLFRVALCLLRMASNGFQNCVNGIFNLFEMLLIFQEIFIYNWFFCEHIRQQKPKMRWRGREFEAENRLWNWNMDTVNERIITEKINIKWYCVALKYLSVKNVKECMDFDYVFVERMFRRLVFAIPISLITREDRDSSVWSWKRPKKWSK